MELRDEDKSKYHGKSVFKAIENINKIIAPELIKSGLEVTQQSEIDCFMNKLDGTENKSKLGANAILGVSLAVCKAGAAKRGIPLYKHIADLAGNKDIILPVPAFNVINGGSHAGNKLAMQVSALDANCPYGIETLKQFNLQKLDNMSSTLFILVYISQSCFVFTIQKFKLINLILLGIHDFANWRQLLH